MLGVVSLPLDQMMSDLGRHRFFPDLLRFKTSVLKSEDELQAHSVSEVHMPVFGSKMMTLTEERVRKIYKIFRKRRRSALKNGRMKRFKWTIEFFFTP